MTLNKELERGARAQSVYDEVKDRIEVIRSNLHTKWEDSGTFDTKGREQAWYMLKALNELQRSFLEDIDTGKLAKAQLEKDNG
jgi:hypothetical protein